MDGANPGEVVVGEVYAELFFELDDDLDQRKGIVDELAERALGLDVVGGASRQLRNLSNDSVEIRIHRSLHASEVVGGFGARPPFVDFRASAGAGQAA